MALAATEDAELMVCEGVGGFLVPLTPDYLVRDLARDLALPVVIVASAGLGTINHTLLTVDALRRANVTVPGVIINRYPPETPPTAEETNPRAIERWGKTKILCIVPDDPPNPSAALTLPPGITSAIDTVDWLSIAGP